MPSTKSVKPNPWIVFLRTNKGKYAKEGDTLSDYKAHFRSKMEKSLSVVEDKDWPNKRKREEYHKILCRYFYAAQKKAGKDSQKNKDDISLAITKVLKKSRSTRATLSAIKKIGTLSASQEKKAREDVAKKKKKDGEALAKKKLPLALQRLQGDLRKSKKQLRFGGVTGRGGRPRAKRVLYDPATGKQRRSPSTASPKTKQRVGLNPVRSTFVDRVDTAKKRARGRGQEKDKAHQCNVIEFMKNVADPSKNQDGKYANTKGLLVAHGMGSGKTLTSLWVAKEYIKKNRVDFVNILAPNVAVGEFIDSFERAGITPPMAGRIRVLTHDEFALNNRKREFSKSLVIVDEAHMFTGIKYDALVKCDVPYIMLLSGTPAPNTPDEIVPLINLLCVDESLRWTTAKWDKKTTTLADKKSFLKDKVSVYNIGSDHNYMKQRGTVFEGRNQFPGYKVATRTVKLSSAQNEAYAKLLARVKRESHKEREKHPFFARERVIVNTHPKRGPRGGGQVTPKVAKVAKDVVRQIKKTHRKGKKDPRRLLRGRLLLYVYNVDVTVDLQGEIRRLCDEQNVSPQIALYNGSTSGGQRLKIKEAFNKGDLDLLIISKAGSVGLDLQCTSKVFMYDMCWNIPQMNQIIGRAIRFKSHGHPCDHEHVDVYIYRSSFATKQMVKVFDHQILFGAIQKWKRVADMIEKVMKPASIKNATVCKK